MPIDIVPYDVSWPARFEREAARVRAALGDVAVAVEHVGSTSVPGPSLTSCSRCPIPPTSTLMFRRWRRPATCCGSGSRTGSSIACSRARMPNINLHVFTVGAAEIDRMLLFRDRLRANDADRDAYLQVKRDLAQQTWRHVQHYADAKTAIVEQIIARATQHRHGDRGRAS